MNKVNDETRSNAVSYSQLNIKGSFIILYDAYYRQLNKHWPRENHLKILDFGCGTGISTRYLKQLGYDVAAVDINNTMLKIAQDKDPLGHYELMERGKIQSVSNTFDGIFSSFVVLEIPTLTEMRDTFTEIKRVLKPNGKFIVVTMNEEGYNHDWISYDVSYPQNQGLKSGDVAKVKLLEINLEIDDYYWIRNDYKKVAQEAGFSLVEEVLPLASKEDDRADWKDETKFPLFVIFVFQRIENDVLRFLD